MVSVIHSPLHRVKCDISPLFLDCSDTSTGTDRKRDYCRKSDQPYSFSCQCGLHRQASDSQRLSVAGWSYEGKTSGPFICTASHARAKICAHRAQRINCVTDCTHTHTPQQIHTPSHTHALIGNSCSVGVQIITNADESSFCEPSPAFLLLEQSPLFSIGEIYSTACFVCVPSSSVRFSLKDYRWSHLPV